MADNYLERRMEDYRNGKLSTMRMSSVTVKRPSMQLRVFIIGGDTQLGIEYVNNLRKCNWKVAFTDSDLKSGRTLAQASGAQHHPISVDKVEAITASIRKVMDLWGAIDIVINCCNNLSSEVVNAIESFNVPIINAR